MVCLWWSILEYLDPYVCPVRGLVIQIPKKNLIGKDLSMKCNCHLACVSENIKIK